MELNALSIKKEPDTEKNGGEDEIRTHGTIASSHAFQAGAFNHSATSPQLKM